MNSSQNDDSLKILINHQDKNEANRLISLFRNANYKADAKHIDSESVLAKLVQESSWDLVLSQFDSDTLPPKTVINAIRRENLDLPVILVDQENDLARVLEGLRMGATDVVVMDQDQHMLQVISRTLYNLDSRRKLRKWQRKYYDSEKRAERLLHNSRDGIAIVQEGTFLYVNDSFARVLDYPDGENMVCLPVIDTVADGYQENIRPYLRHITDEESFENREVSFVGLNSNGDEVEINIIITQVEYEGEPALEFLIPEQIMVGDQVISPGLSPTSTIHLDRTFEAINGAIRKAAQHVSKSALLFIDIDNFADTQKKLGIEKTEKLSATLSAALSKEIGARHSLHRYKENNYILLMQNASADSGLRFARMLCKSIGEKALTIDSQSFQVSLSIGVSVVSEVVTTVDECIDRSIEALKQARKKHPEGGAAELYEQDTLETSANLDEIEAITREYLEKEYYELAFQPIIALHGKKQKIYEVMLQVSQEGSPDNLPSDFIAQLFNTQAALDVDRWVIIEAVKALAVKLKTEPQTKLFINISSATLCDEDFLPWLKVALKASGIATSKIVFQLREIDTTRYLQQTRKFIDLLHKINSEASLSRFGLAIEPLKSLEDISFNYVKFDPQLVKKLQDDDVNNEFSDLLHKLRENAESQVIVPYVETAKMIPELWQLGVHYIQGHFLQAPGPEMNFDFDAE